MSSLGTQFIWVVMKLTSLAGNCRYIIEFNVLRRSTNPEIQDFMNRTGFNTSYSKLEEYYMTRLLERIGRDIETYVWQEVFDNNVEVG